MDTARKPEIIGYRKSGDPIWLIQGGAPEAGEDAGTQEEVTEETTDATSVSDSEETEEVEPTAGDAEALGDAGKKALDSMKDKWKAERDKRKADAARIAELEAQLKGDSGKDDDKSAEKIREAVEKANDRIRKAEVKAAATGKLADPKDAYKFLNLSDFEVSEDGEIDADEISEAIDELIKSKPYLSAQGGKKFEGKADSGARNVTKSKQWTKADLSGKSTEQINKARREGLLKDLGY